MRVRKAVFPAAGWGTRFLPATKAQPKEMLPLVDKPVIQYAVEEAVAAGIEQVIIVTSSQKRAIEDHFDLYYELEHLLEEKGDIEMLRQVRAISDLAQIAYVRQKEQLGLGHAVLMAKELIGHEPFAVILPDDVVVADRPCIGQLIHAYHQTHASVVAVMEVPPEETQRYGVIDSRADDDPLDHGRLHKVTRLVEKPSPRTRRRTWRSSAATCSRRRSSRSSSRRQRGAGGEIQLTDAIAGADGGAGRLRLRVRGHPLRRRDHDGLAEGVGRAGPRATRPRGRVPDVPRRASSSDPARPGFVRYDAAQHAPGAGPAPA